MELIHIFRTMFDTFLQTLEADLHLLWKLREELWGYKVGGAHQIPISQMWGC